MELIKNWICNAHDTQLCQSLCSTRFVRYSTVPFWWHVVRRRFKTTVMMPHFEIHHIKIFISIWIYYLYLCKVTIQGCLHRFSLQSMTQNFIFNRPIDEFFHSFEFGLTWLLFPEFLYSSFVYAFKILFSPWPKSAFWTSIINDIFVSADQHPSLQSIFCLTINLINFAIQNCSIKIWINMSIAMVPGPIRILLGWQNYINIYCTSLTSVQSGWVHRLKIFGGRCWYLTQLSFLWSSSLGYRCCTYRFWWCNRFFRIGFFYVLILVS